MSISHGENAPSNADTRIFLSSEKEKSLRAAAAAILVIARGGAEISGIPVAELVARELGLKSPERIDAQRRVMDLLVSSAEPLKTAIQSQHQHDITLLQDKLPARASLSESEIH